MEASSTPDSNSGSDNRSFLAKNEFVIRRLFSLTGLVPVGAYMCVHLLTNASLSAGPTTFQRAVYQIHSLGALLPVVEWLFIFLPLIFHATLGVVIIRGGLPNQSQYTYGSNIRYTMQRVTGMIALIFIFLHVFHFHGWLHFDWWLNTVAEPLGGAQFRPYRAASSLAAAFQKSILIPILYTIGVLSCVFHLSNGIWSFGIRWGLWTSPAAMKRAGRICIGFGVAMALVSTGALTAPLRLKLDENQRLTPDVEKTMYEAKRAALEIDDNPHKFGDLPTDHAADQPSPGEQPAADSTTAAGAQ